MEKSLTQEIYDRGVEDYLDTIIRPELKKRAAKLVIPRKKRTPVINRKRHMNAKINTLLFDSNELSKSAWISMLALVFNCNRDKIVKLEDHIDINPEILNALVTNPCGRRDSHRDQLILMVLKLRFDAGCTLESIGCLIHTTKENVRQIIQQAARYIRRHPKLEGCLCAPWAIK